MKQIPERILRRMGYKSDTQGLINRFIAADGAWDGHLQHTREFILKTIAGRSVRNLAVYGSGWLLDLPLEELASIAERIWLYDIIHPSQVLHRIRKYANVTPHTEDITGGVLLSAYHAVKTYKKQRLKTPPEELCQTIFEPGCKPDFSISLNILSQIGEMITNYLQQHVPYSDEEMYQLVFLLQQSHLSLLQPGASCLVTDVEEFEYDEANRLKATRSLIRCPLPVGKKSESWEWQFDPLDEYNQGSKTISKVVGMVL
jgi:hypothetical protein